MAAEHSPLVLIADDEPTARLILQETLELAGFRVVLASDGIEALACYKDHSPDLILLDLQMPKLDGFSVCRQIREVESDRKTPIIILTGQDDDDSIARAFELGATDFVNKPIIWPLLVHRIRYVMRAVTNLNAVQSLVLALPDSIYLLNQSGDVIRNVGDDRRATDSDGIGVTEFLSHHSQRKRQEIIQHVLTSGKPQLFEYPLEDDNRHVELRMVARDSTSVLAIVRDITDRKRSETRIYDLAYYDQLTGLPNRELLTERMDADIQAARKEQRSIAVLFIDLDRFKRINDTLGHSMGDLLLKGVADRFAECIRNHDYVVQLPQHQAHDVRLARLGGDEFVIALDDVNSEGAAAKVATRIIESMTDPISCDGHHFVVSPSIGIAMYPQDGRNPEELLMHADSAMYKAKARGRNNFQFYSSTMKTRSLRRLDIENELRQAIERKQLLLHYQPKVCLDTWTIVGAEALIRWKTDDRGWISPAEFVPVAEETGLIIPLSDFLLSQVCERLIHWSRSEFRDLRISINVSGQQLQSRKFLDHVSASIAKTGLQPDRLELEITESLFMQELPVAIAVLTQLRDLGVGISVDDFGTGYSSLSYLKRLPIDTLKIDRSFVSDLHRDDDDAAICAAILSMAKKLNLKVVAEGVEREEQLDFLRQHSCDFIQGYLYSKPLPVDEFENFALPRLLAKAKIAG
jgi:diguanylate cyclase (GGDEF)-like protein